jgi:hypothetical protein
MIENNGTTPEPAQAPVPVTFESLDSALAKIAELEGEVTQLKYKLNLANETAKNWTNRYETAQAVIDKARVIFQEILAGDMDPEGTIGEFREPFELLGVEFTQEVEIEVTATWTVTVTKPFGYELDGHNDFTCEINSDSNEVTLHDSWHTPDIEVREL